jgi:hypothetical protein
LRKEYERTLATPSKDQTNESWTSKKEKRCKLKAKETYPIK